MVMYLFSNVKASIYLLCVFEIILSRITQIAVFFFYICIINLSYWNLNITGSWT